MTSSQPYLLRAIYDWIVDNNMTPYVLVDAETRQVEVPRQYIENGKIVLNLSPVAVTALDMTNDYVMFNARFSGSAMDVSFPISSVLAIYAKENGQGMVFNEGTDNPPPEPDDSPDSSRSGGPKLKLVK
ncbi:MAG: ClpXP protease specificity-enhancing factor [Gammaproteobacteria bacterium]|nr:ClpXP protease specificity-enhancing factor [Gammaproteobacteria bacterium]